MDERVAEMKGVSQAPVIQMRANYYHTETLRDPDNSRRARRPFMMVSRFCSRRDRLSSGGLARGDAPPIRCS
ncbi:hypothetical protein O3P69_003937 [Scylla paramamosain]|uniref:Uncharacterized protein n=1 Tax=Scylla paramamosain TaxID=85552 RepID=A0AAW0UE27_SCYPA